MSWRDLFRRQEKWQWGPSVPQERNQSRYKVDSRAPLDGGVLYPMSFSPANQAEEYTYYAILYVRFHEYDCLSDKEKQETQDTVNANNAEKAEKERAFNAGEQVDEYESISNLPIGNLTIGRDCSLNCGTSPCDCDRMYSIYLALKKKYSGGYVNSRPDISTFTDICEGKWVLKEEVG